MKFIFFIVFFPLVVAWWCFKAAIGLALLAVLAVGAWTIWEALSPSQRPPAVPVAEFKADLNRPADEKIESFSSRTSSREKKPEVIVNKPLARGE